MGPDTGICEWRLVDKMAKVIRKIRPYLGFFAATASSAILIAMTAGGTPVSSTHTINGAIVGGGVTRGKNAVHGRVVQEMLTADVVMIPPAMAVAFFLNGMLVAILTIVTAWV
jgi:PiT family inorganic phosphate transporter